MKKLLLYAACVLGLVIPCAVSALTTEELKAQIETLLSQVSALQQQVSITTGSQNTAVQNTTSQNTQSTSASTIQCPYISRVLKRGMSGADVRRLQQFLALDSDMYPEGQITGYYGALTEAAIRRFQCKNKLVCDGTPASTGYGVTGPRTAALLALQCPDVIAADNSQVGGFIKITPTSGDAP